MWPLFTDSVDCVAEGLEGVFFVFGNVHVDFSDVTNESVICPGAVCV